MPPDHAAAAVLDGHWGFGQVVMNQAVEMALERAGNCGVAAITVKNSNHIGRLGSYVEQHRRSEHDRPALRQLARCRGQRGSLGRHRRTLGHQPAGGPAGPTEKAAHSYWTSRRAWWPRARCGSSAIAASRSPRGGSSTRLGQPSTDPADFYDEPRGSLLPFGGVMGHKGYGLGVVVELLGGALSGAGCARGRKGADWQWLLPAGHRHWALSAARRVRDPKCGRSQTICDPRPRLRASMPSCCLANWKSVSDSGVRAGVVVEGRNLAANSRLRPPSRSRPTKHLAA